jgi:hypothetical protein
MRRHGDPHPVLDGGVEIRQALGQNAADARRQFNEVFRSHDPAALAALVAEGGCAMG